MPDRELREVPVTKGVVNKDLKATKIIGLAREEVQDVVGKGFSEGNVYGGIRAEVRRYVLPMVEKIFDSFLLKRFPEITPEKVIENHARLKKMGFPVINTMRIIKTAPSEPKRILMTDLTEGGRKSVYSSSTDDDDGVYPSFSVSNSDEISHQLLKIYQLCLKNGVEIHHDDVFFLVVDKVTGRGEIVLGDISRIEIHENPKNEKVARAVGAYGYENIDTFIRIINKQIDSGKLDFEPIQKYDRSLVDEELQKKPNHL